jgi:hypothetical protein
VGSLAAWNSISSRHGASAAAALAACFSALLLSSSAGAATVVNGDFETGNFSGWQSQDLNSLPENHWYVYSGTLSPFSGHSVTAPPQGLFAAITDSHNVGTHILYQDVALEAGMSHRLNLDVYYNSLAPIASPDSLDAAVTPNEQYRIDVMRPTAALDSVNPADVLMPVFRTRTGDAQTLAPTPLSLDMTPFAGQTVRLRFAEVENQDVLLASADAVAMNTLSNRFSFGKLKRNLQKGTATLGVKVPGPGALELGGKGLKPQRSSGGQAFFRKTVSGAGSVKLTIRAKGTKKAKLDRAGKVKVKAKVTFTPNGGLPATQSRKIKLKKKL